MSKYRIELALKKMIIQAGEEMDLSEQAYTYAALSVFLGRCVYGA